MGRRTPAGSAAQRRVAGQVPSGSLLSMNNVWVKLRVCEQAIGKLSEHKHRPIRTARPSMCSRIRAAAALPGHLPAARSDVARPSPA